MSIKSKKCCRKNCNKKRIHPIYELCKQHCISKKVCLKCKKGATFNFIGESKGRFCSSHKLPEMVNVVSKVCEHQGCNIQPTFNFIGESKGRFCSSHKLPDMVNVKSKVCEVENCKAIVSTGLLFESKTRCGRHKTFNHYYKNNQSCLFKNCKNQPYYTNDNTSYPKRCEEHKLLQDVNIIERNCENCFLSYFIPLDRSLCEDCFDFKDKKIIHVKEDRIKCVLESNNIIIESYDKIYQDSYTRCSSKRPDFVIDHGTFKIIVEVDENQHESYSKECEITRMKQIYHDAGGYSIVFIRYNPDKYINFEGKRKNPKDTTREKKLLELIYSFKNIERLDYPLYAYYLFYNGYNNAPVKEILYEFE